MKERVLVAGDVHGDTGLDCGQPGYHPGYQVKDSWEILEL